MTATQQSVNWGTRRSPAPAHPVPLPPQEEGSLVDAEMGKSEVLLQWLSWVYITIDSNPQ